MDFNAALKTHGEMKVKLTQYIKTPNGSLDPNVVCLSNRGPLGQWLHNDGKSFAFLAEFNHLLLATKNFHRAAGDIVKLANRGTRLSAEELVGPGTAFDTASADVLKQLNGLRKAMEADAAKKLAAKAPKKPTAKIPTKTAAKSPRAA